MNPIYVMLFGAGCLLFGASEYTKNQKKGKENVGTVLDNAETVPDNPPVTYETPLAETGEQDEQ